MSSAVGQYVGRFAPSPTGPLHFGSLLAAMASYVDARQHRGRWLVRMEDVDEPRSVAGASASILQTLNDYGFHWDGDVVVQSTRKAAYENALATLKARDAVFACTCTRKRLESAPINVSGERLYPGTCEHVAPDFTTPHAWRVRVPDETIRWTDRLLGEHEQHLAREVGAFIVKRSDALFAYQLAVVVDDAAQGITHVVRGADLLSSAARQIFLQQQLAFDTPQYLHIPVAVNGGGEKLSKQTLAPALSSQAVLPTLRRAWRALQGEAAPEAHSAGEFWEYALTHWSLNKVPKMLTLPA